MNEFFIASKLYRDYSQKEGNQHIASEYNLYHILKYARDKQVSKVLEIGTGIGTILSLFQEAKKVGFLDLKKYVGTEENSYCLQQIKLNCLPEKEAGFEQIIVEEGDEIQPDKFEFAIVDGKASNLETIVSEFLTENALILIEGYREDQVNRIKMELDKMRWPYAYFMRFSTWQNPDYGPFRQKFQAGHTIFFINPSQKEIELCKKLKTFARLRYNARKVFNFRNWVNK